MEKVCILVVLLAVCQYYPSALDPLVQGPIVANRLLMMIRSLESIPLLLRIPV